jgi:hypothetical protein
MKASQSKETAAPLNDMARWIAEVEQWPRKDLLRACRFHGISAHRTQTNRALASILWGLRVEANRCVITLQPR